MRYLIALLAVATGVCLAAAGCYYRNPDRDSTAPTHEALAAAQPRVVARAVGESAPTRKCYPNITRKQIERVASIDVENEAQAIAILGEPSERSAVRKRPDGRLNRETEEYELIWYKTESLAAVRITFVNKRKTLVLGEYRDLAQQ